MSKTQKQNLLALSVAGLVASSVAAIAGVTTLNNELTGKAVYLATEMQCGGGCWYDSGIHGCKCPESGTSGGSAYTTSGGSPSGGSAVPVLAPTTSVSKYTQCVEICTMDGWKSPACANGCKEQSGAPSSAASATAAAATKDRCAIPLHATDYCNDLCDCAAQWYGSANSVEKTQPWYLTYWPGKDEVGNTKTSGSCKEVCKADRAAAKAAPPSAPVVETPAPVITPTVEAPSAVQIVPAEGPEPAEWEEDSFEDEGDDFERGGYDDFGDFGDDFGGGFHEGPGDFGGDFGMGFGGHDEEFMRSMMDQYGDEFSLGEDDFSGYFGDFGPGMDGGGFGFGGEFGGGFGGDEFGGMPEWMSDELEGMKDMMRGMAEHMCPDLAEEIDDIEDFEGMEELGFRMQEECMGGDMGGGPDPEMMENAAKMLQIFGDQDGPVSFALGVAQKHDVFTDDEVEKIEGILLQIGEKAEEAKEVCMDLPEPPDMGGDFFGLHGLLAQLFDDEEEDDEEFGEDDEDADDFFGGNEGEIPEEFQVFEDCGNILDEALGAGPGQDEDEGPGGLMGELEELMRVPMEEAVENGTIPEDEWAEVENRFNAVMEDLGFEGEFEDHESDDDFGDFDEEEFEEEDQPSLRELRPASEEEEEEFSDEDFEF